MKSQSRVQTVCDVNDLSAAMTRANTALMQWGSERRDGLTGETRLS
jgi:hypothetical protein